jgi:hypothetical protein
VIFKQIKRIENKWNTKKKGNIDNNFFFYTNEKEKELEDQWLKLEEYHIAKKMKVNSLKLNNQLRERLKPNQLEIDIKFNFQKVLKNARILYKDYINIKTKRENTLSSNTFNNKNNIDYPGYHSLDQDYLKIAKKNKYRLPEKLRHLNLDMKSNINFTERSELLNIRKGSNQFLNPYYFFPRNYNEKNAQGQLRHWTSSIYNHNKKDGVLFLHLDRYVTKLLEAFFNVNSIKRKNPWNKILLSGGFKFRFTKILFIDLYTIMENTSLKMNSFLDSSTYIHLPIDYVKSAWYMSQLWWKVILKYARKWNITANQLLFQKKSLIPLKNKIILSKPLFRHTSYNLIIDLFLYKSKTYKREKLKNILYVRSIYKYLLGMYTNYPEKIRETLNRPRVFYLSLIEPRIYYYYKGIVKFYAQLLPKNNHFYIISLILSFLKTIRNLTTKNNKDLFNYINNRELFTLSLNKIDPIKLIAFKEELARRKREEEKRRKNKFSKSKSRYLIIKNYLKELNRKSKIPLDLKLLTLWSKEGLAGRTEDIKDEGINNRIKKFSPDKFSYSQYKIMNMYTKKRGRKVSKNMLKKRLMNFFLYSQTQKQNTMSIKEPKIINNKIKKSKLIYKKKDIRQNFIAKSKVLKKDNNINYNYTSSSFTPLPSLLIEKKRNKILSFNHLYLNDSFNKERNNNFYLLNVDSLINKNVNNDKVNNNNKREILEINWLNKEKLKLIRNKNYSQWLNKNMKYDEIINKSKVLWSVFNSSLLEIIIQTFDRSSYFHKNNSEGLNNFLEKFRYLSYSGGDYWYLMYSIGYIKSEFYKVNRDVLITDQKYLIINEDENNLDYLGKENLKLKDKTLFSNTKYLGHKLGYSEKTFRPYYRYMIPLLILKTFNQLLLSLGYKNFSYLAYFKSKAEENAISNNIYVLFNFVMVKTLLDLFFFSYRSLVRIKPSSKYYYINKIKLLRSQIQKLTYKRWTDAMKRIKRLYETSDVILHRYDGSINKMVRQFWYSVQEERKWKILNSFVLYFEDILYVIYGKWVIIRIWPLKKYILSSYILTKRIMLLIQWRNLFVSNNSMYKKLISKLVKTIKFNYLKKSYDLYLLNRRKWPSSMIDYFRDKKGLNFTNLEYFNEEKEKNYVFNSYVFDTKDFNSNNYINEKRDRFIKNLRIKLKLWEKTMGYFKRRKLRMKLIKRWFNRAYLSLLKGSDISGIKFKLEGRTQFSKSNQRSYYKTSLFGLFKSPSHFSKRLPRPLTPFMPLYRGYIKANVDSHVRPMISKNGTLSVKVWIMSFMTTDIEELLLHLLRIKELYNILLTKFLTLPIKNKNFEMLRLIKTKRRVKRRKRKRKWYKKRKKK